MITNTLQFKNTSLDINSISASTTKVTIDRMLTGYVEIVMSCIEKISDKTKKYLPVYAFIIHHPKHGHYLVDAGIDESFINNPYGSHKGLLRKKVACKAKLEKNQSIKSYIERNNISIKGAFLTHMHFDHIAGMIDLPNVTTCIMGKGEKYNPFFPLYYGNHLKHINTIEEIDFSNAAYIDDLGYAVDFFGDKSLIVVSTAGHTKGHISILANTRENLAFIASDAYFYESKSLMDNGPGSYSQAFKESKKVLDIIYNLPKIYPNIKIYTGHGE